MSDTPSLPTYGWLVANHYTTLVFSAQFSGTDDELRSEILKLGALSDMEIARIEVTNSLDDGQKIRLSSRLDEDGAVEALTQMYSIGDGTVSLAGAKMITTKHEMEFDDTRIWPEEQLELAMAERGIYRLEVGFSVPPWFPMSLVQSLVSDALRKLLRPDPDDQVEGVSTDRTLPGYPSYKLWVDESAYHRLQDTLEPTVTEWIEELATNDHVRRWLQTVYSEYYADTDED